MTNIFSNITIFAQAEGATPLVTQDATTAAPATQQAPAPAQQTTEQVVVQEDLQPVPEGPGWNSTILIYILLFVGIFFLMFMPQRKQRKAMQKLQSELKVGDTVVTAGGIYGKIATLEDGKATLELEQGRIQIVRSQIVAKVNK